MAACAVCPTKDGCIVCLFWWFSSSLLEVVGLVTSVSASVSVMAAVVRF